MRLANDRIVNCSRKVYGISLKCFYAFYQVISLNMHLQMRVKLEQAVREAAQYAPAPVRRTLQSSSSPYTPYACGAQRALRHEYS